MYKQKKFYKDKSNKLYDNSTGYDTGNSFGTGGTFSTCSTVPVLVLVVLYWYWLVVISVLVVSGLILCIFLIVNIGLVLVWTIPDIIRSRTGTGPWILYQKIDMLGHQYCHFTFL